MLGNEIYPGFISGNAKWLPSEILGGLGMGVGNLYIIVNDADTAAVLSAQNTYGSSANPDGSVILRVAAPLTSDVAIQAALDACVANRNDYVVVMPSDTNYSLTAALTMSKKAVHLICPTGLSGNGFPIGNTARIKQLSANPGIIVSAQAIEIAGFYLKNYSDQSFISLKSATTGSVSSLNIHHNMFPLVLGSNAAAASIASDGTGADDGGSWGSIENNQFITETGTGKTVAIVAVKLTAYATGARVCHNEVTIGDGNTATIAISNLAVKGHTDFNVFSACGGIGATPSGGAITKAVTVSNMACAIGNLGAVATTEMLAGGTANNSYTQNFSALSGGTVATS